MQPSQSRKCRNREMEINSVGTKPPKLIVYFLFSVFYYHLFFVILFSVFVAKTLLCCGSIVKHRRANVADERARTEEALSSFELRKVALSLFQTLPLNMLRASMQRRKHTQPDLSLNMHNAFI